jgi:hypothetical protein
LRKAEVVGICRPSAANQAKMLGDRSDVIMVTHLPGLGQGADVDWHNDGNPYDLANPRQD